MVVPVFHTVRLSLWAEHLGDVVGREEVFSDPNSLACMRRVNAIAHANWDAYVHWSGL